MRDRQKRDGGAAGSDCVASVICSTTDHWMGLTMMDEGRIGSRGVVVVTRLYIWDKASAFFFLLPGR